jgi:DNA-binding CsgD family transcriptional regulator
MYADAGIASFMLGRPDEILRLGHKAYVLSRGTNPATELIATVALAAAYAIHGRREESAALLAGCADELWASDPITRAQEYAHAAFALLWLEDYAGSERLLDRMIGRGRAVGAVGILPQALAMASELYYRLGRWPESRASVEESLALAAESRQPNAYGRYFLARMDGVQGRVDDARRALEGMAEVARHYGAASIDPFLHHALGLVALGRGDANDAIAHLEECSRTRMAEQMPEQAVIPWAYDLVEAYARAGRAEDAEKLLARTAPDPGDATHRWAHAVTARCRGLLAARGELAAAFDEALRWHERDGQPFERARTLLCLGERLRRERLRAQAREPLRVALQVFVRLGALDWAARARAELEATGETRTQGDGATARLTPQELQVAMVVARGASNSEAAAALFLSPKTIEYHLSNIYRKTGLQSRSELTRLMSAAS